MSDNDWRRVLRWSRDVLAAAAHGMTFNPLQPESRPPVVVLSCVLAPQAPNWLLACIQNLLVAITAMVLARDRLDSVVDIHACGFNCVHTATLLSWLSRGQAWAFANVASACEATLPVWRNGRRTGLKILGP